MPSELSHLLDQPYLLAGILLVGVFIGTSVERFRSTLRWRARRNNKRSSWEARGLGRVVMLPQQLPNLAPPKPTDAADQLRIVMMAEFTVQPVLNRAEARVFRELESAVTSCAPGWQVLAQVSLGEILRSKNPEAYGCINSKRVDLLLVDENCQPRHAIEYQGLGHHQSAAAARDAVKKEALRRAGIGYHEVVAGHTTPSDLRRLIERIVGKPGEPTQPQGDAQRSENVLRPA